MDEDRFIDLVRLRAKVSVRELDYVLEQLGLRCHEAPSFRVGIGITAFFRRHRTGGHIELAISASTVLFGHNARLCTAEEARFAIQTCIDSLRALVPCLADFSYYPRVVELAVTKLVSNVPDYMTSVWAFGQTHREVAAEVFRSHRHGSITIHFRSSGWLIRIYDKAAQLLEASEEQNRRVLAASANQVRIELELKWPVLRPLIKLRSGDLWEDFYRFLSLDAKGLMLNRLRGITCLEARDTSTPLRIFKGAKCHMSTLDQAAILYAYMQLALTYGHRVAAKEMSLAPKVARRYQRQSAFVWKSIA